MLAGLEPARQRPDSLGSPPDSPSPVPRNVLSTAPPSSDRFGSVARLQAGKNPEAAVQTHWRFRLSQVFIVAVACTAGCQSSGTPATLLKLPTSMTGVPQQYEPDVDEVYGTETGELQP